MGGLRGGNRILLAAIATGLLVGLGATGFHYIADSFGEALFRLVETESARARLPFVILIPTLGLFLVGLVLHWFPVGRNGGMREVLEAIESHGGRIPFVRMLNVVLSAFVLAFGGSVGPEGPMVQMGAVFGSIAGQRFRISTPWLETMVRAGAAAGIAAGFRSPAGAVLLTVEIFGARMTQELAVIAVTAGLGYVTRTVLLGDAFPFRLPVEAQPLPLAGLVVVAPLMGLVAAPTGHFFISMFDRFKTVFPVAWPLPLRVAFGGLLVGLIGIRFPQVLSAGYPVIVRSLHGGHTVQLFVTVLFLKMLATSITFGSGAVGGLFAPTLVIGAMYGGAWGYGVHAIWPQAVPQPELFVLLGMIVMFGSIVKGYWSGLLMIADMSGCYHQLLLPGIVAAGIAFVLSWRLHDKSIFGLTIDPYRARS